MSLRYGFRFRKLNNILRLADLDLERDEDWIAWWYCGINKNLRAASQPLLVVEFRRFHNGAFVGKPVLRAVPIEAIGQVRLGTVWRNGISRYEIEYSEEEFSVDFSKNKWKFSNFELIPERARIEPFPLSIYKLEYEYDKNWLLEFPTEKGGNLVIPCLEFYGRCYGRSDELKRVLATYPWAEIEGGAEGRLYLSTGEPEEDGKWKVKLKRRMRKDDVVFLAHVKYDPYAKEAAKRVYSQIEKEYEYGKLMPIFIQVEPWFQGPARIKVRGISFNDNKSFLGLQIVGSTDPWGVPIARDRENSHLVDINSSKVGTQDAWGGVPVRVLVKPPEIIDLTAKEEPTHGAATIEVEDPAFEILGTPRIVVDVRSANPGGTQGANLSSSGAELFSTGDPSGSRNEVGYAAMFAPTGLESHGALRDMWNALVHLSKMYPELVSIPQWYTYSDGFCASEEPRLIPLKPFPEKLDIAGNIKTWPYLNSTFRNQCRGLLVARIKVSGTYVHFIEIQRKPHLKTANSRSATLGEEAFRGFVFILRSEARFREWLHEFLDKVRRVQGVVQKLVPLCPGVAATFNHTRVSGDAVLYISTVKKALGKVDRALL